MTVLRPRNPRFGALALLFLPACGGEEGGSVAWGVLHGSLLVTEDGIEGYEVWELFDQSWAKEGGTTGHICSQVSSFSGELVTDEVDCSACLWTYAVLSELSDSDCPEGAGGEDFGRPTHLGFGEVPGDLIGKAPAGDSSMGWYVSWDGASTEAIGYASPEAEVTVWDPGNRFILDSPYGWEL